MSAIQVLVNSKIILNTNFTLDTRPIILLHLRHEGTRTTCAHVLTAKCKYLNNYYYYYYYKRLFDVRCHTPVQSVVKIISILVISWISHRTSVLVYTTEYEYKLCACVQCTFWFLIVHLYIILLFINEIIVYSILI